jgi:phage tail-like protein
MNINGSRYFHILGEADWGACTAMFNHRRRKLGDVWEQNKGSSAGEDIAVWDAGAGSLTIARKPESLPPTPGEPRLRPQDRRDGVSDAFGNLYVIGDDRKAIEISGAGQSEAHLFWPDPRIRRNAPKLFSDVASAEPIALLLSGLAITTANYLIAAGSAGDRRWLLRFDLVGGGEPEMFDMSGAVASDIVDIVADHCGGIWLLEAGRLLRFGTDLQAEAGATVSPIAAAFQPVDASEVRVTAPVNTQPPHLLPAGLQGLQLGLSEKGEVVVLARRADGTAEILVLDFNGTILRSVHTEPKGIHAIALGAPPVDPCAASLVAGPRPQQLFHIPLHGNQVFAFNIIRTENGNIQELDDEPAIMPMRRFGGRGLVLRVGSLVYDSGATNPLWVPLLTQLRRSYAEQNEIRTAIFDAYEPQCQWDRIRLDAVIPPGTSIVVEARSHDDRPTLEQMGDGGWIRQPGFYLNSDGGEIPGKREIAILPTDKTKGSGCWDMLFQDVTGRFLQLRLTLTGDGRNSPALHAMRLWYPRFSYPQRFLPAVYREDPVSASFLDRYLASMEGMNSVIEARVASAQTLFDPRTAPAGMLEWLASWFDVMLDPSWNEGRRRLFIANAMTFFGWRGTIAGVKMALRLAFDKTLTAHDFRFGGADCTCPGSIRIVEAFSTAPRGWRFGNASVTATSGPQSRTLAGSWAPADGAAGLIARLPEGSTWSPAGRFPLFPPEQGADDWAGLAQSAFGFVPTLGAAERSAWIAYQQLGGDNNPSELPQGNASDESWAEYLKLRNRNRDRWQSYLRQRYRSIKALKAAHSASWDNFGQIPLPSYLPNSEAAIQDWLLFEGQLYPRENAAHRFSVLIPLTSVNANADELAAKMALAQRIVAIEKPAHTVFDVRLFWAMNRLGEARLGQDTLIGAGSRAPELIPPAIIGQAYLGSNFVGGPQGRVAGRERLAC